MSIGGTTGTSESPKPSSAKKWDLDAIARRGRLVSGIILFVYVLTHLLNHSLGILDIDLMERVQEWRKVVTRHPVGTVVLYGALITHVFLALGKTASRHSIRLPKRELIQLLLGVAIPILLIEHLADTRISNWLIDFNDTYRKTIPGYWPREPWLPVLLALVVWGHACIGMHFWLNLYPWYQRTVMVWHAVAILVPTLAIAGYVMAGKTIEAERKLRRAERAEVVQPSPLLIPASFTTVAVTNVSATSVSKPWTYGRIKDKSVIWIWMYVGFAALAFITPLIAIWVRHLGPRVKVRYPEGRTVSALRGASLLEVSRSNGIPHTSVCGGRGRCSTCRVHIGPQSDPQPDPKPAEAKLLEKIGAPKGVRLACQLRPVGQLSIVQLVAAKDAMKKIKKFDSRSLGVEREIVVLFADLRGFTSLSEDRLPYDTIFLLNEYFTWQQSAIRKHGGRVDKFMGDGIMALFGAEDIMDRSDAETVDASDCCKNALNALTDMLEALDMLNQDERLGLEEPLRMAIGVHVGTAVLGDLGAGQARRPTAIGDVVNAAARLESLAKEWNTPVVASVELMEKAGWGVMGFDPVEVDIRGKQQSLKVVRLDDPAALSS
ncbi:MAG: adenylate/guanylate cyclase domain-containing protein [Alphaproteobacteria bacterium]|nr:adenylate/guanylate cyclase domain-containing protein [Alphaproteobacteria bacterium SS10]